jgi:hypothetical protein
MQFDLMIKFMVLMEYLYGTCLIQSNEIQVSVAVRR